MGSSRVEVFEFFLSSIISSLFKFDFFLVFFISDLFLRSTSILSLSVRDFFSESSFSLSSKIFGSLSILEFLLSLWNSVFCNFAFSSVVATFNVTLIETSACNLIIISKMPKFLIGVERLILDGGILKFSSKSLFDISLGLTEP